MNSKMTMKDLRLISLVKANESLYSKNNNKSREMYWKTFSTIFMKMGHPDMTPDQVSHRWKQLREAFVRENKQLMEDPKATRKFPYYDEMAFLEPYIRRKKVQNNPETTTNPTTGDDQRTRIAGKCGKLRKEMGCTEKKTTDVINESTAATPLPATGEIIENLTDADTEDERTSDFNIDTLWKSTEVDKSGIKEKRIVPKITNIINIPPHSSDCVSHMLQEKKTRTDECGKKVFNEISCNAEDLLKKKHKPAKPAVENVSIFKNFPIRANTGTVSAVQNVGIDHRKKISKTVAKGKVPELDSHAKKSKKKLDQFEDSLEQATNELMELIEILKVYYTNKNIILVETSTITSKKTQSPLPQERESPPANTRQLDQYEKLLFRQFRKISSHVKKEALDEMLREIRLAKVTST